MTKVRVKASAEAVNQALEDRGDFVLAPIGLYCFKVIEATAGFSKDSDGNEDESRPRVEVVLGFESEGRDHAPLKANYGRIWHYLSFSEESAPSRANFIRAFFPEQVQAGSELDFEFDTDDLVERMCMGRVKHEKDNLRSEKEGKTVQRARIATFFPLDEDNFTAAENATDAYAPADDPNPFDESGGGDDGPYTEEELMALDAKELGAVAKEFELDPNDFIVRNRAKKVDLDKTKAALVAAIMEAEAEGEGQDTGATDNDDSPF